jgi:signal transduction histidine kinase
MSISPDVFGDLLGDAPVIVARPAAHGAATPHEFSELLASSHLLHSVARDQMALLMEAVDSGHRVAAAAGESGVILHARSDIAVDSDRLPGARLFTRKEEGVLRGGRAMVYEGPPDQDCDLVVPFFQGAAFGGAVGLRIAPARVNRAVIVALGQAARTLGALVDAEMIRVHHEQAIGTIGHEIRQPLSALVTALDLLQRMSPATASSTAFRAAERQALRLVRLVDTLLDAARLLGGRLQLNRHLLDLRGVIAAGADSVRADIEAKNQQLIVDLPARPVWCVGDADRLQEVAINLLTNANRYTPAGGTIAVTATQSEATVTLSVRDTGVGIDEETRQRMFRPFERPSHSREGLGLGLAICVGIVRGHGGALVALSNAPDAGTTLRVELPGLLGRTREICAAVQRTRSETRVLVERARALRQNLSRDQATTWRDRP